MGSDSIENIPTEDYMWSFRRKLNVNFFSIKGGGTCGWGNVLIKCYSVILS